jgi:hypothetical protein
VNEQGQLTVKDVGKWAGFLSRLKGKVVEVQVRPERKRRSLNQNSWYWVAVVPAVAQYLSEATGREFSDEQAHYVLKSAFIGVVETPLGLIPLESKTLTTEEFAAYCEKIRAHCASEWGFTIPGPEAYWSDTA